MLYFSIDTVLSLDRFSRFHKLIFVTPLLEFEMFVNVPVKCICQVLLNCMAWDANEYLRKFNDCLSVTYLPAMHVYATCRQPPWE